MELDINELLNFSPLMKTFTFNAWVVAGFTPITRGSTLDYYINRPQGMKGYIINLTLRGQARAKAGDGFLLCRENDLLLFPPGVPHHYGRDEHSEYWDHLWIYFIPRPYWIDWLKWDQTTHGIGKTTINDPDQLQQLRDLFYEVIRHHSASVPLSEALAMNALERLILRCFQQQPISNRHAHDLWGGDRFCMRGSLPRKTREALRDKDLGRTSRICTAGRKMRFCYDLCDEFCTITDC